MSTRKARLNIGTVLFLLTACLCLRPAGPAAAEDFLSGPWQVTADRITYTKNPETIRAQGNVILQPLAENTPDPLVFKAERMVYDIAGKTVKAFGSLNIKTDYDEIWAEEGILYLNSRTGTFKNATLLRGKDSLRLTGEVMEKTGDLTYYMVNSWATSCQISVGETPPWSIWSKETRVTKEGYASLKHASFKIKGRTILYSPYLLLPAKTERQTGLLFPEISNSERDGQGLLAPLFINLSPSSDATLYLGALSKRGANLGAEFRYIADLQSRGTFAINYLQDSTRDSALADYNSDGFLRTRENRYWVRGKADHVFANGLIAKLDIDMVSDRDFLQEFRDGMTGFRMSSNDFQDIYHRGFQPETVMLRDNTMQLSNLWTAMGLHGELWAVDDASDQPASETPPWAMPRLYFTGLTPIDKTPLDLTWESEYTYYWRERGVGAHRFDLHPRLISQLPLGPYLEATASGGLRETLYFMESHGSSNWSGDKTQNRELFDLNLNIASTLVRDFNFTARDTDHTLHHTIRPYVDYGYTPLEDQSNLPDFDGIDRIQAENRLQYGLRNYLRDNYTKDGAAGSRDFAYLDISQAYDFRADRERFSDIFIETELSPFSGLTINYETQVGVYGDGVSYYDLKTSYTNRRGDKLSADYYYKRDLEAHEINASLQVKLTELLSARYDAIHSFNDNVGGVESSLRLRYQPGCWSMEAVASKTSEDTRFMLVFSLSGLGKAFEWGRSNL